MKFDELPLLLDGAQTVTWILSGDAGEASKAALGRHDDFDWATSWWEAARYRYGMDGEREPDEGSEEGSPLRQARDRVTATLSRLHDALRSGEVCARAGGRIVEAIEWATLGMVEIKPNLLVVRCSNGAVSRIIGEPVAFYRDGLRKLREPPTQVDPSVADDKAGHVDENATSPHIDAPERGTRPANGLDPAVWLVMEIGRRREGDQLEPTDRETMMIALKAEFPELDKNARRDLIKGIPDSLKGRPGPKKSG